MRYVLKKVLKRILGEKAVNYIKSTRNYIVSTREELRSKLSGEELRFKRFHITCAPPEPKDLESIFADLDAWVSMHGEDARRGMNGYVPEDFIYKPNHGFDPGIQQVRSELREFVAVLLSKGLRRCILEIGLGNYGGTHILWRSIFDKVVTIEISRDLIKRFKRNESLDSRSLIIMGASQDPRTIRRVHRLVKSVDVLFIDGGHTYEAVFNDWLMYHDLVSPGGLVVFHDSIHRSVEVAAFLEKLSKGEVDGKCHKLYHIIHSCDAGISYEEC